MSLNSWRAVILIMGAALTVVVLVSVVVFSVVVPSWAASALVVVVLIPVAVAFGRAIFIDRTEPRETIFGDPTIPALNLKAVDMLVDETGLRRMDATRLRAFVAPILRPETVFHRIGESVLAYHRSVLVKTVFALNVRALRQSSVESASAGDKFAGVPRSRAIPDTSVDYVVPLLVPPRGQLIDGLRVFDASEKRVSTLSARRVLIVGLAALRALVHIADPSVLKAYIQTVEPDVVQLLRSFASADPAALKRATEAIQALSSARTPQAKKRYRDVTDLLAALARLNPVCVVVPTATMSTIDWPSTLRFRMERRFVTEYSRPTNAASPDWWIRLVDAVGMILGVRPNRIYFVLVNAARTYSYHLQVEGPPGTYLARQDFIPRGRKIDATLQSRRGQRRAHVLIRRMEKPENTAFAAQFTERAPGSFALTSASALAAAVVIGTIAWRHFHLPDDENLTLLPGLLAIPVGVAALAGLESFQSARNPSLLSRLLSISTVAACLTAFLLTTIRVPFQTDGAWLVLTGVISALVVVSFSAWLIRLAVELRIRTEGDGSNID